ncbi:hypothetical protein Y1Q_0003154 [Alligator mississippiensis]|uniref:Uncharacterized protein n=1 Tax=Alligator mississippiensis TaxID=8496 RepID=A0A151MDP4_ALLMI|nr:hypothetical protein Y1Q_0003154 [Alligator mississippiensis]
MAVFETPSEDAGPPIPDDIGVNTAAGPSRPKKQSSLFNKIPNALARVRLLLSHCLPHPRKFRKTHPRLFRNVNFF